MRSTCPHCKRSVYYRCYITKTPELKGYEASAKQQTKKAKINKLKIVKMYYIENMRQKVIAKKVKCSEGYVYEVIRNFEKEYK